MVRNVKIAVHIQSEVQFFSLEPLLKELKRKYEMVEIVYDDFHDDQNGYKEMAEGVRRLLRKAGYKPRPLEYFKDVLFDIYLTSYVDKIIKAKCYLKYEYGTLNIKPSLTYIPVVMDKFHGFLCQSTITNELLRAYGATFPVDNLRFYGRKKKNCINDRKVVLFAPTYNDQDEEEWLTDVLENLKKQYYVIVKGHHGTNYLKINSEKKCILEEMADEYYGSDACLSDLILRADVCLFDNSSAIGEALYARVPFAIFAKNLDLFKLGEIHTTQYQFVSEGLVPYTDKAEEVNRIIERALTNKNIKLQNKLTDVVFPPEYRTGVNGYMKLIDYFLNDKIAKEYVMLHDFVLAEKNKAVEELKEENEELKKVVNRQNAMLEDASKKKLYKLADKIYKIEGKVLNGKS